jgi:hypothetical protein
MNRGQRKNIEVCKKAKTMYEGKHIKITRDFSMETLKARRAWHEAFQA